MLLTFWATWCSPCVGEFQRLNGVLNQLAGKPFEIVAVSVDENRDELVSALLTLKPGGVQTWDEAGEGNPVAEMFNVQNLPTWYLIDQHGVIRVRNPRTEDLTVTVDALLKGQPPPRGTSEKPDK